MENKENKKWSLAHICAYVSLALSITMLVLWCCNVGGFTVVSLDSFVGVIVALLAIVVTLAIAWQIYNSIELKNKIEELNVLKDRFCKQEKDIKIRTNHMSHLIFGSLADIEISNRDYITAFRYLMISLEHSVSLDMPVNIDTIFQRMDLSISEIKQDSLCPVQLMEKIQNSDNKIRKTKCYSIIKNQYEEKYNKFISRVKYDKHS